MTDKVTLAEDFVSEYLDRDPEYLDVAEFVSEWADEEDLNGELITAVYNSVINELGVVRDWYASL